MLWILQVVLALLFASTGATKLARDKVSMVRGGMAWAEDLSEPQIKFVGVVEVLGALGLVLPTAVQLWEVLTPIAASGLTLVMLAAVVVHRRRGESVIGPLVVAVLVLAVAVARFGPYAPGS